MVAIRGPIIAAPLAMPSRVTSFPEMFRRSETILGRVSVVMIARAASRNPDGSRGQRRDGIAQPGLELRHRELMADDAGGRDEDLLGTAAEQPGGPLGGPPGIGQALVAGRRVGVARVDHDGDGVLPRQQFPAPLHRRGTDPVGRERAGRRAGPVGDEHRQVGPARRLDPRLDPRGAEAARDEEVRTVAHADMSLPRCVEPQESAAGRPTLRIEPCVSGPCSPRR